MSALHDQHGFRVSGATSRALELYERALAAYRAWRGDPLSLVEAALREAPEFVMAHLLRLWLLSGSRDPASGQRAIRALEPARALPRNRREALHLAALEVRLLGDLEATGERLGALLAEHPRDLLALQVAHGVDYFRGDALALRNRALRVLPAWSAAMPGYHAVLAMLGFGLAECGDHARAAQSARHALALEPADARAWHVLAHAYEHADRAAEGERELEAQRARWDGDTMVAAHLDWHLALYRIAQGRLQDALAVHDARLAATQAGPLANRIDAATLLWRLELAGAAPGERWQALAEAWAPHATDGYCAFNDVHAMLAFVAAGREDCITALLRTQRRRAWDSDSNGRMTADMGLPASPRAALLRARRVRRGRAPAAPAAGRGAPPGRQPGAAPRARADTGGGRAARGRPARTDRRLSAA